MQPATGAEEEPVKPVKLDDEDEDEEEGGEEDSELKGVLERYVSFAEGRETEPFEESGSSYYESSEDDEGAPDYEVFGRMTIKAQSEALVDVKEDEKAKRRPGTRQKRRPGTRGSSRPVTREGGAKGGGEGPVVAGGGAPAAPAG